MIPTSLKATFTAITISILAHGITLAAPYAVGSMVRPFTTQDQHERDFTFKPAATRFLLVSHDMDTGKRANAVLTTLGKDYLGTRNAVYLANIHGMPGIGRMFAMPKMRKYAHRIILADDAALIARFPEQKNQVTVLKLNGGKVTSIAYWQPGAEPLDELLK